MWNSFCEVARLLGDTVAISNEAQVLSFSGLQKEAEKISEFFRDLEQPVVWIALPGGPDFTAVQLAIWSLPDGVAIPIPEKSSEREALAYLEVLRPDFVVVRSLLDQQAIVNTLPESVCILSLEKKSGITSDRRIYYIEDKPANRVSRKGSGDLPKETRMIQFTSGSTGKPKGILLSNENLISNLENNSIHLSKFSGKHAFSSLPQFHAMGGAVVLEHLWSGSPIHVANRFLPGEHVSRMQKYSCKVILSSPNYLKLMLDLKAFNSSIQSLIESFTVGTAALSPDLVSALHSLFPESEIYSRYGLSESIGALTLCRITKGDHYDFGTVGKLIPNVEFHPEFSKSKDNPGEIVVKSSGVGIGQLSENGIYSRLVDTDGFLHTGDIGFLDASGCLYLSGRKNNFIKSNGYRISAMEIELMLKSISEVQEAVVFGVQNSSSGEKIVACLEPMPGKKLPPAAELDRHCRSELSAYKVPQKFIVFEQLPRTQSGKPDLSKIRLEVQL
ncbi:hypothetical protein CH373_05255 [Leptospira perolatii]|uniref:Long-chain fatty acid--CoA ligase n=1 Tax=Leptospira perolatii TaxID=2023191 RepID=A0A2M9ZQF3_9LEPT|nr:class I adenylate-forming enzyme family protein [Leptospira perolatii]PJZ70481.1 hypothetical protein CH360_05675 [Leptospira perolatii]PJZ74317.1 hypothetical protein CH373_05255 [Leptospira perolatii]